jgi:hypothetical protein
MYFLLTNDFGTSVSQSMTTKGRSVRNWTIVLKVLHMGSCSMHAKFRTMQMTPHSSMNQDIRWDLAALQDSREISKNMPRTEFYKSILLFTIFCVHPA